MADSEARPRIHEEEGEEDVESPAAAGAAGGRSKAEASPTRSDLDRCSILEMVGLHEGTRFTARPTQVRAPDLSPASEEETDTRSVSVDVRALGVEMFMLTTGLRPRSALDINYYGPLTQTTT